MQDQTHVMMLLGNDVQTLTYILRILIFNVYKLMLKDKKPQQVSHIDHTTYVVPMVQSRTLIFIG